MTGVPRGILYVESEPSSPGREREYHHWYDEVHLPQVLGIDGFVSARRFAPAGDGGRFVTIYELDGDDLGAVRDALRAASQRGDVDRSDVVCADPPPTVRLLVEIADAAP